MTEQEKEWFQKLVKDREESANTLEKPSMSGFKRSVSDKYSESAHFIYELLQNADDVKATECRFALKKDGLYFIHNGQIKFSISDPENEENDAENEKLGHINSVCSVGNSSKAKEKNKQTIGKFGVGFKAVFQYTQTPHIYEKNFKFKIERFFVPSILEKDIENIKDNTCFYFPFDNEKMPKEKAHSDILEKLKSLSYPILFLSNLQKVEWKTENNSGKYTKSIVHRTQNDIKTETQYLEIFKQVGLEIKSEKLLLFSRKIEDKTYVYSVGFFLDNDGKKLLPKQLPAFCFFPTQRQTNLNFIIHAPFLLTDSREGIKEDEQWNKDLVEKLAKLSADSLLTLRELKLIDDSIINIIPYKNIEGLFNLFYTEIREKFQTEELLPSRDGTFIKQENAYWAEYSNIVDLYSDAQISAIQKQNCKLVFVTMYENSISRADKDKLEYINSITSGVLRSITLLNNIKANFIQEQSFDWLHKFYEYIYKGLKTFGEIVKVKPIFIDSKGNAVPAFIETFKKGYQPILFLPNNYPNSNSKTINNKLLENETSRDFFEAFGIKEPNERDEILGVINNDNDISSYFDYIFNYWNRNGKPAEIIELLSNKSFIKGNKANSVYFKNEILISYFETKPNINFLDIDYYHRSIEKKHWVSLDEFFTKIGIAKLPRIKEIDISDYTRKKNSLGFPLQSKNLFENEIDGMLEILSTITQDKSKVIWKVLIWLIKERSIRFLYGIHKIQRGCTWKEEQFESSILRKLKSSKWLFNKNNVPIAPNEIQISELLEDYDVDSYESKLLIDVLGFKLSIILTPEQKIAQMFENEDEAKLAKELLEKHKAKQNILQTSPEEELNPKIKSLSQTFDDAIQGLDSLQNEIKPKNSQDESTEIAKKQEIDFNENEELAEGMENLKKQLEIKKNRSNLSKEINNCTKYSYDWFIKYLKLLNTYGENQNDKPQQQTVTFQEIKQYKSDNKYFLLCGANKYISSNMEDGEEYKMSLFVGNKSIPIDVEGISKKGQDLLAYCRQAMPLQIINILSNIRKIEFKFTPIIDLLKRLLKTFENKNYIDEWQDIKNAIPQLSYIYGPPGTGKTTTLCNTIKELLKENSAMEFLVLTPTNKAADVLCKKLKESNDEINIARLGSPTEPELNEIDETIYRSSMNFDDIDNVSIIASTIHRLPYFEINETEKKKLFKQHFDYVIFDESSMIPLHYIVFALLSIHKNCPQTKFIVAGDPKQIPPVVEVNDKELENFDFQDENIYKMLGLESFDSKEQNIREGDEIKNLDRQYRSVKEIGQLFSELSYSKLLKHDCETNHRKSKSLPIEFQKMISANVTFIDIPLNEDNSIYKVNKLNYSSYQTYSAILVAEIIKYFDSVNKEELWTIGLITPYKAQAVLLNKLVTSYGISEKIRVYADTVHGFQGDECDIVFFICNPNGYSYSGFEKCLLSKEYIYNVAISRAKDYLIVLHPFNVIKNNPFICKIEQSYRANFGDSAIKQAVEIEKLLFNNEKFIENNSYSTGHDNVNVFGLSDMRYFIKVSDNAIDIRLNDTVP